MIKKHSLIFLLQILVLFPQLVYAQQTPAPTTGNITPAPVTAGGGSTGGSVTLGNPLGQGTTLLGFFQSLLAAVMVLAVPIIVFFIILAGFKYVTARGNATKVGEAHMALLYAILGGVLILGAQALLVIIESTVNSFAA
ncbi:hypothetical protein KC722_01460 [Candidatus Kaiserbacteria bacterium]|nr:hypothetical protein [Candidatus Kaiserbacteria bacterium]